MKSYIKRKVTPRARMLASLALVLVVSFICALPTVSYASQLPYYTIWDWDSDSGTKPTWPILEGADYESSITLGILIKNSSGVDGSGSLSDPGGNDIEGSITLGIRITNSMPSVDPDSGQISSTTMQGFSTLGIRIKDTSQAGESGSANPEDPTMVNVTFGLGDYDVATGKPTNDATWAIYSEGVATTATKTGVEAYLDADADGFIDYTINDAKDKIAWRWQGGTTANNSTDQATDRIIIEYPQGYQLELPQKLQSLMNATQNVYPAGYSTFNGWQKEGTSAPNAVYYDFDNPPYTTSEGVAYKASWGSAEYTVTLNANGGLQDGTTTSALSGVYYGERMPSITLPTRAGYKFLGYFDTATGDGATQYYYASGQSARNWDKTDATQAYTLYARWEAKTITVVWDINNLLSSTSSSSKSKSYIYGETPTVLPTEAEIGYEMKPTREGYTFGGWFDTSGNMVIDADGIVVGGGAGVALPANDERYTAQWIINTSNVTFNMGEGQGLASSLAPQTVNYGETAQNPGTPTWEGHEFAGWYTDVNCTDGNEWSFETVIYEDTTLYAKWTVNANIKVITYNANVPASSLYQTVTNMPSPLTFAVDSSDTTTGSTLSSSTPAREGYTFKGWATNAHATASGSDTLYQAGGTFTYIDENATTLYAVWEANDAYIQLVLNGGTLTLPDTFVGTTLAGKTEASLPVGLAGLPIGTPTKTGCIFTGWYTSASFADGTFESEYPTTFEAGYTRFYAKWSAQVTWHPNAPEGCTVRWGNGDVASGNLVVTPNGGTITAEEVNELAPTCTGYVFKGWALSKGATATVSFPKQINDPTDYYAVWQKKNVVTIQLTKAMIPSDASDPAPSSLNYWPDMGFVNSATDSAVASWATAGGQALTTIPERYGYEFTGYWSLPQTGTEQNNAGNGIKYIDANGKLTAEGAALTFAEGTSTVNWYAQWRVNLQITFNFNQGSGATIGDGGASQVQTMLYGSGTPLTTVESLKFTKTGYHFKEWQVLGTSQTYEDASIRASLYEGASPVTLVAQWEPNTYTIRYVLGEGVTGELADSVVNYDAAFTFPTSEGLTKENSIIIGWTTDSSATTAQYVAGSTFPKLNLSATNGDTINMYAVWKNATGVVTFILNGADSPASISDQNVAENEYITEPSPAPTRKGYTLLGWYKTGSDTAWNFDTDTMTANSIVLTAQWTANTYTIKYNINGGTFAEGTTELSTLATYNENVTFQDTKDASGTVVFSREGYQFLGWATSSEATVAEYTPTTTTTPPNLTDAANGEVTLYAVWKAEEAKIVFNTKGGSTVRTLTGVTGGAVPGGDGNMPGTSRTGYTFGGWWTQDGTQDNNSDGFINDADWGTQQQALPATYPAGTTTYYVKWTANTSIIKLVANGGTLSDSTDTRFTYDEASGNYSLTSIAGADVPTTTAGTLAFPTMKKEGYQLVGWYLTPTSSSQKQNNLPATFPAAEESAGYTTTYYAIWNLRLSITIPTKAGVYWNETGATGSWVRFLNWSAEGISIDGAKSTLGNNYYTLLAKIDDKESVKVQLKPFGTSDTSYLLSIGDGSQGFTDLTESQFNMTASTNLTSSDSSSAGLLSLYYNLTLPQGWQYLPSDAPALDWSNPGANAKDGGTVANVIYQVSSETTPISDDVNYVTDPDAT